MIRISFWTAVFLILLRVCIGWHFAYEGLGKVRSAYQGKSAVNEKVFTSEGYFRESEGPFGKLVKSRMVDPDQEVIDKLTLKPSEGDDVAPARFPEALAKEWDDYLDRFVAQYKLDEETKAKAQARVDESKATVVKWIQGVGKIDPKTKEVTREVLTVKRKAPGVNNASADFDQEMTVAERAAELKQKSEEIRTAYARMEHVGRDVDVLGLRAKKAEANTIRTELQKEIDDQTKAMKDGLAKLLDPRVTAYAAPSDSKDSATLEAMLTPMSEGNNPLEKMWDDYATYVKDFAPDISNEQKSEIDEELRAAKARFNRWLADKDPYTGKALPAQADAPWREYFADRDVAEWRKQYADAKGKPERAAELRNLTAEMQSELKTRTDVMRAQVGAPLLGEERAKGYAAPSDERKLWLFPKNWSIIDYLDWSTRWFLLVVGVLLIVGLFTRLSCFSAAVFLLLTILTQPSVPWLPSAPTNEGNYLFVNKNVIEMVALLALMTTRSGKWAGLDAIVCWIFGGWRKKPTV